MNRFFLTLFVLTAAMYPHRAWCQSLDSIYGIHLYSPDDHHEREQIREIRNKGITYKAIYQSVIDSSGHVTDSVLLAEYRFAVLPNQLVNEISVRYDSEALTRPDSGRFDTIVYDPYDRYIFSKRHKWTAITNYHDSLGYAKRRWIYPDTEKVDSFTFNRTGGEIFTKNFEGTLMRTYDSIGQENGGKVWNPDGKLFASSTIRTEKSPLGSIETTMLTTFLDSVGKPEITSWRDIFTEDYQKHQWAIVQYKEINGKWNLRERLFYDSTFRIQIDSNLGIVTKSWHDGHDSVIKFELNNKLVYTKLRTYDSDGMPLSTVESRPEYQGRKVRTDYFYEYGKKE